MIIVALVATLAGSMVWQQWRAIQVEAAERARAQSAWILAGAVDWARLILREDYKADEGKKKFVDHLGEPWSVPLAEARLSTFLAADKDNNTEDAPDAFLSGVITDAMARYNLTNLVSGNIIDLREKATLLRLCETVGVSPEVADRIANALRDAAPVMPPDPSGSQPPVVPPADPPLMPRSVSQLAWIQGIDAETLRILEPYLVIIPDTLRSPNPPRVNVNTASREVIFAAIPGLDLATAERIVQSRQSAPFESTAQIKAMAPGLPIDRISVSSSFFEIRGRLRLDNVILEQRSLVKRINNEVVILQRERVSAREQSGS